MSISSSFFCTVRPAPGFILPESFTSFEDYLKQHTKSAILAVEKQGHQQHIHFCFISLTPRRKSSVLRSIKTIVDKHYANAQIDVKIALNEGAYFYTIKDGNIKFSYFPEDIIDYIDLDSARSAQVVEELTEIKQTRIKFSYTNRKIWVPFFKRCRISGAICTVSEWQRQVYLRGGNLANSQFMWDFYYKQYNADATQIYSKKDKQLQTILLQEKDDETSDYDEPLCKKQKFDSETEPSTDDDDSDGLLECF